MLFRILGLSFWLSLGCLSAYAQDDLSQRTLADATFKQQLRNQYLKNDTAQAIINLYGKRQGGGIGWISGGLLGATQALINGGSTTTVNGAIVDQQGANVGGILVAVAPFVGYGISKLVRFSNQNLEATLTAYGAGQPLPSSVRRRLKPRFFKQAIMPYVPVQAVPAR